MSILFLVAHPSIRGPLPKIVPILLKQLESLGCEIQEAFWSRHSDHESFLQKIVGRLGDLLYVRRQLRSNPVDVMVITTTHDWMAMLRDLPLLLVVRSLSKRIVIQFHGGHSELLATPGHRLMKFFTRQILRRVDAVLLLSCQEVSQWQDFYPSAKYYRVDNPYVSQAAGFEREHTAETTQGQPRLVYVGRLVEEKGVFDLLEAAILLRKQMNFHLTIAGVGPELSTLVAQTHRAGLEPCVSFPGYLHGKDLSDQYLASDLFVFPTYFPEGFPTVITEAMDAGLPVVTTCTRGVADHLQDGVNAIFVPPRNPSALAAAMLKLINDPGLRRRMAMANREKVKDFAPEPVARHYLSILEEVVGTRMTREGRKSRSPQQ